MGMQKLLCIIRYMKDSERYMIFIYKKNLYICYLIIYFRISYINLNELIKLSQITFFPDITVVSHSFQLDVILQN